MKNVLVIGGSYFAGRVFVEELLQTAAYSVSVLNRGRIPMRLPGVLELRCDRRDLTRLAGVIPVQEWEAVVDFCAYSAADIEGTLGALPEGRVRQYIFVSTASVYAPTHAFPVAEDDPKLDAPPPALGPAGEYAWNKWRAEVALQEQAGRRGIPSTCVRPVIIYGKYNYAPRESWFFDLVLQDRAVFVPAAPLALTSFVSVWDLARLLIRCIGNPRAVDRAFNAAADELVSYSRFVEVLGEVSGRTIRTVPLSAEEIASRDIPLPFPFDEHLIYSGRRSREELGATYTPFAQGLRLTWECYLRGRGAGRERPDPGAAGEET